ncbi:hypothetical protein [Methylobacterium sp. JK268]
MASELERNLSRVDRAAAGVCVVLAALVAGYAYGAAPAGASALVTAVVIGAVAVASALLGGLAGFLFGIPRLLARGGPAAMAPDGQASAGVPADLVGSSDAAR